MSAPPRRINAIRPSLGSNWLASDSRGVAGQESRAATPAVPKVPPAVRSGRERGLFIENIQVNRVVQAEMPKATGI
jgi:hypothetical protein